MSRSGKNSSKALVILLALTMLFVTACQTAAPSDARTIRYELGTTASHFSGLVPAKAKAGETVELRTEVLYDADIHVYVDGEEIPKSKYESDGWAYSFVMPDKDVLVTARFYTEEEIWGEASGTGTVEDVDHSDFRYGLAKFIERSMGENLRSYMVSPLSFQYALGMLLAGAEGETKTQLLGSLAMTEDQAFDFEAYIKNFNSFAEWFGDKKEKDLQEYDNLPASQKKYTAKPGGALRVADSVWKREDLPDFLEDYMRRLETYDAGHFSFTPSDVVERVNEWADEKTEGMIPKLLPANYDAQNLAVVLMNALYYKNGWEYVFRDEGDANFTTAQGETVQKPFMASAESYLYYKDDETELVTVPMQDGVYMTFVLGSAEDLERKMESAEYRKVTVRIPKFEIESSFSNGELMRFLAGRGATDVFDPDRADLSGMLDLSQLEANLYVGDIVQKTKIKLDETGVEAAAVTAVMVYAGAVNLEPTVEFRADRPFRFLIHTAEMPEDGDPSGRESAKPTYILFEGLLAE